VGSFLQAVARGEAVPGVPPGLPAEVAAMLQELADEVQ